jgi:hypothetical protein
MTHALHIRSQGRLKAFIKIFLTLAIVAITPSLFACAACAGGKTDSELAKGMNAGIFALLAVVGVVLTGAASFAFYIVRRASRMGQLAGTEPVAQPTI